MSEAMDHDVAMVTRHIEQLGEYFDSVHIFATRHEPETEGGTIGVQKGMGNMYARMGQIREWCVEQDELTKLKIRKDNAE